jgi:hypothetical protein
VGFSPRGICFSDFFSNLFSRAVHGAKDMGFSPGFVVLARTEAGLHDTLGKIFQADKNI